MSCAPKELDNIVTVYESEALENLVTTSEDLQQPGIRDGENYNRRNEDSNLQTNQEDRYTTNNNTLNRIQDSNNTGSSMKSQMSDPNYNSTINQTLPNSVVKMQSNRNILNDRNDNLETYTRKTDLRVNISAAENSKSDTETDAKPATAAACLHSEIKFPNHPSMADMFYPKSDKFRELEGIILRPKDQFDEPLNAQNLVDVVIVYAKSDYCTACRYKEYLEKVAKDKNIDGVIIALYTREDFPTNDVKVVEEVVNRSMRIVMLLSENFGKEVNLTFIKEEAIGLTRLQEYPPDEQMSLFATAIVNRKKDAIRPVHTVPKSKRYYRTPVGLSVLRAFEYFDNNKNQNYEDDMSASFLKQARTDRINHCEELGRNQSFNNPNVVQNMEQGKAVQYYKTPLDSGCGENHAFSEKDNITDTKPDQFEASLSPFSNFQESSVVCKSEQVLQNSTKTSSDTMLNTTSSGFVPGDGKLEAIIKQETMNEKNQNSCHFKPKTPTFTENRNTHLRPKTTKSEIPIGQVQSDILTQKDVETDASSSLPSFKLQNLMGESDSRESKAFLVCKPMDKKLELRDNESQKETNKSYHHVDKTGASCVKLKGHFDDEEMKSHNVSYSGPPARSGIRTGATPGYGEYMHGVHGNSHGTTQPRIPSSLPPQHRVPVPPVPPPVVTTAQSIHYHYHYGDGSPREDLEVDQDPQSIGFPTPLGPRSSVRPPQQTNTVPSGPVFHIQSCGTVQIGDYNTLTENQNVEGTNSIRGGAREESESHINLDRMPADGNSESVTEEERLIMQGSSLISLNDLSSTIEKETEKEHISGQNTDDDNFVFTNKNDGNISDDSENDNEDSDEYSANLSTSFTDKEDKEKFVEIEELYNGNDQPVENIPHTAKTTECSHSNEQNINGLVLKDGYCCQHIQNDERIGFMASVSVHLRAESRKKVQCTQFHFNKSVCSVINTDHNYFDDVD